VEIVADHTRCELLIADLALRLVTVEPNAIDDVIGEGLRRMAELLGIDEATMCRETIASARLMSRETHALMSIPLVTSKLLRGEPFWFSRLDDVRDVSGCEALQRLGVRSAAVFPVASTGRQVGPGRAIVAVSTTCEHDWSSEIVEHFRLVSAVAALGLARKAEGAGGQQTPGQMRRMRESSGEGAPRPTVGLVSTFGLIVSESAAIRATIEQLEQVAPTPATVLLLGETGVGKEVFAQAIHDSSPRRHRQMVRVNCAAIPATLIESELFGRERGAFTGALARQAGRFELAQGSTIFLDEIGELPLEAQVKLLRVLQDKVVERLGGGQSIKVDVRIIAATNRDLEKCVANQTFREDLYYRLNVFPVTVPPLRDRTEDIPALVWAFVDEFSKAFGKHIDSISKESLAALQQHAWPGNVRELRNLVERAVILTAGPRLAIDGPKTTPVPSRTNRLIDLEAEHIRRVLESVDWRVRGAGGAAELLGLKPTTLDSRMEKLGVVRPERQGKRCASGAGYEAPVA
jgi:transcriptional regulator with GAF, ATPase, and Fis domain